MKDLLRMKKALYSLIVLIGLLGVSENAWGAGSAYSRARGWLKPGSPVAAGKVYVSQDATPPADGDYVAFVSEDKVGDSDEKEGAKITTTYYFYAKANEGYNFTGWYLKESDGSYSLVTKNTFWSGAIKSGSEPSGISNTYADLDRYAEFVKIVHYSFVTPEHGSFVITHGGEVVPDYQTFEAQDVVHVKATPADGYRFAGWYSTQDGGVTKHYFSFETETDLTFLDDATIGAEFWETNGNALFYSVDGGLYDDLNAAIEEATSSEAKEVYVAQDGILPAGDYTIPEGVTLFVPYSKSQTPQTEPHVVTATSTLSAYRTITLMPDANIVCNGTICVGGQIMSAGGGKKSAYVTGECGVINMANGGHIELNDGAMLYCWGFIKGQDMDQGNNTVNVGTITANDNAVIWENFEVGDWRGGTATYQLYGDSRRVFPFQSYSIQNVEIPTTYKLGSTLKTFTTVYGDGSANPAKFPIIGSENALFLLQDAASIVRKWYDPTTDLSCYELSGTAQLAALNVQVLVTVSSSDYNLPISNSMHVILTDCDMTLSEPIVVQAGAVFEIKNDATVNLETKLYMFDVDEWGKYIHNYYFRSFNNLTSHKDRGDEASKEGLDDAKIIIDGTLNVVANKGYIYATTGGANLMGNDGGVVHFQGKLPSAGTLYQVTVTSSSPYVEWAPNDVAAANLHNEDDSYTKTADYVSFYNIHGRWFHEEDKDEQEDHTYLFTYMEDGNSGDDVVVSAIYSHDKTGLEAREKWFNVEEVDGCPELWQDTNSYYYNYTISNAWHQFIETATENLYSSSNNKLYAKDGCTFEQTKEIDDETCLYAFGENDNRALFNGSFISLHPNPTDAAYLNETEDKYYICFKGCNWHEAVPFEGEEKAYNIAEGGTYIWFEGEWMFVERESGFFYTTDEQTNVKTFYEYVDGEWLVATPYVCVDDGMEQRMFFSINEAFDVASIKRNATIILLRDITEVAESCVFATKNTTCTLNLNGHTLSGSVNKLVNINAPGCTFTITDKSEYKLGKISMSCDVNARWYTVFITDGDLVMDNGSIYAENTMAYSSSTKSAAVTAVYVTAGKKFTLNDGLVDAHSCYYPRGIDVGGATTADAEVNINGGTITAEATVTTNAMGIYAIGGAINIHEGATINAKTKTTSAYGIYVDASTSKYFATLNMDGGIVNVSATTGTALGIFVNGVHVMAKTKPNTITSSYYGVADISGGTFTVKTINSSKNTAYGIQTRGTTTISGGSFTVTPNGTTAEGVLAQDGTTTISGGTFTVKATATAYGVYANGAAPDTKTGRPFNPTVIIEGGAFDVRTSSKTTAYGVYVTGTTTPITSTASGYYAGNYASAGDVTINGGEFTLYTKTTGSYGVVVNAAVEQSGATGYDPVTATPKCTINGGKFKSTSGTANSAYAVNDLAEPGDFQLKGGYFNHEDNLATYAIAPKGVVDLSTTVDANYPTYTHKIAEVYAITFMNGEETMQSAYQELGSEALYKGDEPIKDDTSEPKTKSYQFDGWSLTDGGELVYAKGATLPEVTGTATYYAHFTEMALKYRVHFVAGDGECAEEYRYVTVAAKGTKIGALPVATKTGYSYAWYNDPTAGKKITKDTLIKSDRTFYARYSIKKFALTYNFEGATVTKKGTVGAVGTANTATGNVKYNTAITSPTVSKPGYTFKAWSPAVVSPMPAEAKTYEAVWTPNTNTPYQVLHKKQNPENLEEYITVDEDTEESTGTTGAYVTPNTKSYVGYVTPAKQTVQILADGSLVVEYLYNLIPYTITFDAATNDGICDQEPIVVPYGLTIGSVLATLPTATKEGNEFQGWFTKSVGGNEVSTETVIQWNVGTVYAQFRAEPILVVDGDVNISNNSTVETTTIHVSGRLTIDEDRTLTTTNFILEASANESGEVLGNIVAEHAYFDLKLNTDARHWRAFGVPWAVDIDTDPLVEVDNDGNVVRTLNISRDYEIMYYDGAERAANGPSTNCWKYLRHYDEAGQPVEVLQPGRGYMIAFGSHVNTVRFTKKSGAPIMYTGDVTVQAEGTGTNQGINAVSNPMAYHANMDLAGVGQVHDGGEIGSDGYDPVTIANMNYIVGKTVYVQVEEAQTISVANDKISPVVAASPAPRRAARATDKKYLTLEDYYTIALTNSKGEARKLYVLPEEEKEDQYVIGHDLVHMGMSTKKAQIWAKRYDVNLCLNTTATINDVAKFPINVYAPSAGEYIISLASHPDDEYTVYLTNNGRVVWNLSDAEYMLDLPAGVNNQYGLRLVKNAPQITTGIDEAVVDAKGETRKVLINNQVYIIRGGEVYTVTGAKIQ